MSKFPSVDIVLPIHNALDFVKDCVNSLLASDLQDATVYLVDDKSTDPNVLKFLKSIAAKHKAFQVVSNDKNLGFVKTVNKGMRLSKNDIILLNSDTVVSKNWLGRLKETAYADPKIATVTPLSNNATILSVPHMNEENRFPKEIDLNALETFLKEQCPSGTEPMMIPTAIGFCMYIKRSVIDEIGYFDDKNYVMGYCEENDFCERAKAAGYWHAAALNTIVLHQGSASFGDAQKQALINKNLKVLNKKYPNYLTDVNQFILQNPLKETQQKVYQYFADIVRAQRRRILYALHTPLHHNYIGGTEYHVKDLMTELKHQYYFCVSSFFKDTLIIEEHFDTCHNIYTFKLNGLAVNYDEFDKRSILKNTFHDNLQIKLLIRKVLEHFDFDIIHVKHLIRSSFDFITMGKALGKKVILDCHDFYLTCPTINLRGFDSHYCKINHRYFKLCAPCIGEHLYKERDHIQQYISAVDLVTFPSQSAYEIVKKIYRLPKYKVIENGIRPEEFELPVLPVVTESKKLTAKDKALVKALSKTQVSKNAPRDLAKNPLKFVFLGEVSRLKGLDLILEILNHYKHLRDLAKIYNNIADFTHVEFHILGHTCHPEAYPLLQASNDFSPFLIQHGKYDKEKAPALLREINPDFVCLLSTWPETFSYTLSESLACGIPVIVAPYGALKERVERLQCGFILKDHSLKSFLDIIKKLQKKPSLIDELKQRVQTLHIPQVIEMTHKTEGIYKKYFAEMDAEKLANPPGPDLKPAKLVKAKETKSKATANPLPKVTVITPTHQRAPYLQNLYHIFKAQTYPNKELLILDDSPRPSAFFKKLQDPEVRYFYSDDVLSVGEKRNELIAKAAGDIIVHFDDDDYYAPQYIEKMLQYLEGHDLIKLTGWYGLSLRDKFFYYLDTTRIHKYHFSVGPNKEVEIQEFVPKDSSSYLWGFGFSYVYRKSVWEKAQFADVSFGEDFEFLKEVIQQGMNVHFIPDEAGLILNIIHRKNTVTQVLPNYALPLFLLPQIFGKDIMAMEPFKTVYSEVMETAPNFMTAKNDVKQLLFQQ